VRRFAFVTLLVCLGLIGGTALGGLFVPPDSGLAGPAVALGYGAAGGLAALAGGIILAIRLAPQTLQRALLIEAALVVAVAMWIGYRMSIT
jgi:hypothetical protein